MALGAEVGRLCLAGDCIALTGDLGAGKTRFVRGIASGLGIDPSRVHSPTFVLVNLYRPDTPGSASAPLPAPPTLVHIDAYRLTSLHEVDSMGLDGAGDRTITVIEWADRIAASLPDDRLDVRLEHAGESARTVEVEAVGESWKRRLASIRLPA